MDSVGRKMNLSHLSCLAHASGRPVHDRNTYNKIASRHCCRLDQPFDLALRQVLAGAQLGHSGDGVAQLFVFRWLAALAGVLILPRKFPPKP
jgi:hypothetical protein